MRPRALGLAALALAGATTLQLSVGRASPGDQVTGGVAAQVRDQLRYVEPDSSVVLVYDLRYRRPNWSHVRALGDRMLREARRLARPRERREIPPTLNEALIWLARGGGLSFARDVRPLLDGYLVIGVQVPPRQPLPPEIERIRELLAGAYYDARRRAYVRRSASGQLEVVRHPDGRPVTPLEAHRVRRAESRRDLVSEPDEVWAYRTRTSGLGRVVAKVQGSSVPLRGTDRRGLPMVLPPLPGHPGVRLVHTNTAVIGDHTLLSSSSPRDELPQRGSVTSETYEVRNGKVIWTNPRAAPSLLRAVDRARAGAGTGAQRIAEAQRISGIADPLVLAAGSPTLGRLLLEEPNLQRVQREVPYLRAVNSLTGAVGIGPGGLEAVGRVTTDGAQLTDGDLPVGSAGTVELPHRVGEIVSASRNQSATTAFLVRLARTAFPGSEFVRAVEEAERELEIDFNEEFLRQFDCPSASVFDPGPQRFAARSCVRDPERMRNLLPRLAPRLPSIVRGLQSLENVGLVTLLLIAPDAPLTPAALGTVAALQAAPLSREGEHELLYELSGLRDPPSQLGQAGPDRVVFGMIGDVFVVASDRAGARTAAALGTVPQPVAAASLVRVPAALLLTTDRRALDSKVSARVFRDLSARVTADRSALTVRAELGFQR